MGLITPNLFTTNSLVEKVFVLYLELLLLLWSVNFVPLLLGEYYGDKWSAPIDFRIRFVDGKPLLGPHKTIRGLLGAVLAGAAGGALIGIGLETGAMTGLLSMAGDLSSSFVKRRFSFESGRDVPGLDQVMEGLFPLLYLRSTLALPLFGTILLLMIFAAGAFAGSILSKRVLFSRKDNRRPSRPLVMFREFVSCRLKSPLLRPFFNFEDAVYYHLIIQSVFRILGLYERGKRNALNFQVRSIELSPPDLPEQFDNYRILFMTDLHLDGMKALADRLQGVIEKIEADLCILGGDYRMATHGSCSEANFRLKQIVSSIATPDGIIAILGNHDCLEMADILHEAGATVLLNESLPVRRNSETIWIAGVDDPHYFKCHDLPKAFQDVPPDAFSLFVAHTPGLYKEAASAGARLYLAGHTHAGQVQLPGIGPLFTHCAAPRRFCLGEWSFNGMEGFTSSGVGVSGVPVRFNCQGEIALITLRRNRETLHRADSST